MSFQPPPPSGGHVSAPPASPRPRGVQGTPAPPVMPNPSQAGPAQRRQRPPARQNVSVQPNPTAPPGTVNNARASSRLIAALSRSRAWARPASAGARLAAFSIDAVFMLLVAGLAGLFTSSVVLAVLTLIELVVILLILESRTGITLGNLLLQLRTVRDDAPFSPGVARGFLRGLVQGIGSSVALVGGWIVVATSAADPMRMGRSFADRAGRTMVVRVPTRAERAEWARGAEAWVSHSQVASAATANPRVQGGAQAPPVMQLEQPVPVAPTRSAPPVRPQAPPPQGQVAVPPQTPRANTPQAPVQGRHVIPVQVPGSQQFQQPGQPVQPVQRGQHGQQGVTPQLVRPSLPSRGPNTGTAPPRATHEAAFPAGVVPVDAPIAAPPPVRHVEVGEQLLLTFDTGQRAQLQIPVAVNLGRKPEQAEPEDQVLVVQDPENSVSKTHLRLEYRGESVWLTDMGSTNGSEVFDDTGEGVVLTRGVRVRLEDGSRVRVGSRSFTVATVRGAG